MDIVCPFSSSAYKKTLLELLCQDFGSSNTGLSLRPEIWILTHRLWFLELLVLAGTQIQSSCGYMAYITALCNTGSDVVIIIEGSLVSYSPVC